MGFFPDPKSGIGGSGLGQALGDLGGYIIGRNKFRAQPVAMDQTVANIDKGLSLDARKRQDYLSIELQKQMLGRGPTVAGQQMQQGMAEAMARSQSQAASGRGVNRGMAFREAAYAGQNAMAQQNRDAALLRAQEQLSAQQQYGGVANAMRQGDLAQRGQTIQSAMADQDAAMQAQQINAGITNANAANAQKGSGAAIAGIGALVAGGSLLSDIRAKEDVQPMSFAQQLRSVQAGDQAALQSRAEQDANARIDAQLKSMQAGEDANRAAQSAAAQQAMTPQSGSDGNPLGGAMQMFGSGLMSDARSKERIRYLEGQLYGNKERQLDRLDPKSLSSMSERERMLAEYPAEERPLDRANPYTDSEQNLNGVKPYQYRYKPEFADVMAQQAAAQAAAQAYADARKPRVGVMTQDLQQTPGGSRVVMNTPIGQAIDMKRGVSFALANEADLNERLRRVERKVAR